MMSSLLYRLSVFVLGWMGWLKCQPCFCLVSKQRHISTLHSPPPPENGLTFPQHFPKRWLLHGGWAEPTLRSFERSHHLDRVEFWGNREPVFFVGPLMPLVILTPGPCHFWPLVTLLFWAVVTLFFLDSWSLCFFLLTLEIFTQTKRSYFWMDTKNDGTNHFLHSSSEIETDTKKWKKMVWKMYLLSHMMMLGVHVKFWVFCIPCCKTSDVTRKVMKFGDFSGAKLANFKGL